MINEATRNRLNARADRARAALDRAKARQRQTSRAVAEAERNCRQYRNAHWSRTDAQRAELAELDALAIKLDKVDDTALAAVAAAKAELAEALLFRV